MSVYREWKALAASRPFVQLHFSPVSRESTNSGSKGGSPEGGYWIPGSPVELGGALSRLDADSYTDTWDTVTVVLNLHANERFNSKLQIMHSWISSRFGIPGEDFREARVEIHYVW